MEFLQDFQNLGILDTVKNASYFDTVKNASYLFLGMLTGYFFWDFCERFAKVGISYINPVLYLFMVIWGASGFFFLPYVTYAHLSYFAIPDWDIPLKLWMQLEFLQHRSWLFSSILIPLIFLAIVKIIENTRQRPSGKINTLFYFLTNSSRDIIIGLSVGISAHLLGDCSLYWIPSGDTSINIFGWLKLYSLIWLLLNMMLGLVIPFLIIRKIK